MKLPLVPAVTLALMTTIHLGAYAQAPAPAPAGNDIRLLSLNQPPCKVLSAKDVITAKVAYRIADSEQSAEGFAVSIKFQGTDPRLTFSVVKGHGATPPPPDPAVTLRSDTLTLTYRMIDIVQDRRLRQPITCYFYLHRNLGQGRSTVIARTPPIVFSECQ